MNPGEAVISAVLACILGLLAWAAGNAFANTGVPAKEVALLVLAIVLAGVAFGRVLRVTPKLLAQGAMLGAGIAALALLVVHFHLVPVCGDKVCGPGECGRCREDCSLDLCANGMCEPPAEQCSNTRDCRCSPGLACVLARNTSDERGCAPVACGDSYCDVGETTRDCCVDCGCPAGFGCQQGKCFYVPPDVTFSIRTLTTSVGATSLAGNPLLTDGSGTPRPLVGLLLSSDQTVSDVSATFEIPGVLSNTVPVGKLHMTEELPVLWYVRPDPRLLSVREDRETNITITVRYRDAQEDDHTIVRAIPFTLRGRAALDDYGHLVLFVIPVQTRESTPQGIWDELRANFTLGPRAERVQFPLETLSSRRGSPRDVAILLVSAYDAKGVRASLVEGPAGVTKAPIETWVRVRTKQGDVLLDPARFNTTFDEAIITTPGFAIHEPKAVRSRRNFTMVPFDRAMLR